MKNNKGFTLIELLAVIIILGILMIIAIPSVTKYISDSRKNSYIGTAKEIIAGARNIVNDGKLEMFDTGTNYYIDASCIKTENGEAKSPYGEFTKAYVVVIYDGKGYEYYWTSVDEAGEGIKNLTKYDNLDSDQIESDLNNSDITTNRGIDGRVNVQLISKDSNCQKTDAGSASTFVNLNGDSTPLVYPRGKTKDTVVPGDIVRIGSEEFYVVRHDVEDLVLLAHYNLKVGIYYDNVLSQRSEYTSSDPGYGMQGSDIKGYVENAVVHNGMVEFSHSPSAYWSGKVETTEYPGIYCYRQQFNAQTNCAFVYYNYQKQSDSKNAVAPYVNAYKTTLENMGVTIKDARLLRIEEAYGLGCRNDSWSCSNAPSWVYETSYWLGSPFSSNTIWDISTTGRLYYHILIDGSSYGVRPVIVI